MPQNVPKFSFQRRSTPLAQFLESLLLVFLKLPHQRLINLFYDKNVAVRVHHSATNVHYPGITAHYILHRGARRSLVHELLQLLPSIVQRIEALLLVGDSEQGFAGTLTQPAVFRGPPLTLGLPPPTGKRAAGDGALPRDF